MQEPFARPMRPGRLSALRAAIDEGAVRSAERMLSKLHPAEIAQLLESLPQKRREIVWELTDPELDGDVLVELSDEVRAQLIREMEPEELAAATENLEIDDLADLVADLPETVTQQLLHNMDQQDRERLSQVLEWPEDSAGGLMSTDTVSVRGDVSVEVVQRYLRMRGELPERTDRLFAVDRHDRFLGTITLSRLLTEDPETLVGASLDADAPRIAPETPAAEVSQIFRDRDLVSAPVVDETGRLLGRITIDDVVDVITEEAAHEVMAGAGLRDEEDVFASIVPATRRRIVWLAINLFTASLGGLVVQRFEGTVEKVAALAVLMPVVSSMGGIAGTQTVTLIIRGLALGQVQWRDARWLLWREVGISALTGTAMAVILGGITVAWLGTWKVAPIIGAAMVVNLFTAAVIGVMGPLTLRRLSIDPALSAGVILTTFTDCIGFATLLGLGTLFLT
ncbi:MAG TPA: magnesium transporter [Steroidobacteraceae bacterium]|nr:magnesium transporter [Steroidobacteraceae bacterium]